MEEGRRKCSIRPFIWPSGAIGSLRPGLQVKEMVILGRGLSLQVRYARGGITSRVAKVREDAAKQVGVPAFCRAMEYAEMLLAYA